MKLRKILALAIIVIMFILVSCIDTIEGPSKSDIASAKVQAQMNMESRCK